MKELTLTRLNSNTKQTEGVISVGEEVFHTLERPWLNNIAYKSCIPKGTYKVKRDKLGKHQYYAIQEVPNRSAIEIHVANKVDQLQGCIALGYGFNGKALIKSQQACERFLHLVGDEDFELEIIDAGDEVVSEPVEVIEEVEVKPTKKQGKIKKALSKLVGSGE